MTEPRLREILEKISSVRIAVVGDFFLDRYWKVDPSLDEPSVETDLTAQQIVDVWSSPGAAGTVTNNLAAIGVGKIHAVGFVGSDGEGFELRRELDYLDVDSTFLVESAERRTPCYTKPLRDGVEMNRFDIKNRTETPASVEAGLIAAIRSLAGRVDAMIVMDQVSERNCGVVTDAVREELARLGRQGTKPILYADSRERIGLFREMIVKCNDREAAEAFDLYNGTRPAIETVETCGINLSRRTGRPVFVTLGADGQMVLDYRAKNAVQRVPAVRVEGEIDICGAGDASSSAIVSSLCAGANCGEAALIGNLASSITIRKIGQTGTATPEEILAAHEEYLMQNEPR